jgi:hypothetical protein
MKDYEDEEFDRIEKEQKERDSNRRRVFIEENNAIEDGYAEWCKSRGFAFNAQAREAFARGFVCGSRYRREQEQND